MNDILTPLELYFNTFQNNVKTGSKMCSIVSKCSQRHLKCFKMCSSFRLSFKNGRLGNLPRAFTNGVKPRVTVERVDHTFTKFSSVDGGSILTILGAASAVNAVNTIADVRYQHKRHKTIIK